MKAKPAAPGRTYELRPILDGWVLKLYENGRAMGGGFGVADDYSRLLRAAEQFCAFVAVRKIKA